MVLNNNFTIYILYRNHPENIFNNKTYSFKFSFKFIEDVILDKKNRKQLKVKKEKSISSDVENKENTISRLTEKQNELNQKLEKLIYETPKDPRLKYLNGGEDKVDGKDIQVRNQIERLRQFLNRTDIDSLVLNIPNDFDYKKLITAFHNSDNHMKKFKQIVSQEIKVTTL